MNNCKQCISWIPFSVAFQVQHRDGGLKLSGDREMLCGQAGAPKKQKKKNIIEFPTSKKTIKLRILGQNTKK